VSAARAAAAAAFQAAGGARLLRAASNRWALDSDRGGLRLKRRSAPPFLVLIYHRVLPEPGPFMLDAIRPERFDRQMKHLAAAYRPLPLDELIERSRSGTVPKGAVAVTFDDGYADNFEHAFPILKRHGIPATVFLVTGCVGTGRIPWHDQVLLAFAATRRGEIHLPGVPAGAPPVPLETVDERRGAAFRALASLKAMPDTERLSAIEALRAETGGGDPAAESRLMLDWDRVRVMRRAGIRFGSHTETHPILSRVTSERAREEVTRSKREIERALEEEITLFAYPNGRAEDYTDETVALLREAGYRAAVTTNFGVNETGDDPFRWRRGTPWEGDPARFALKLAYYRLHAAPARRIG
jgi:peptidoglycan/xylan/chitin deacetylase (PgdA/CDA1 family)